MKLPIRQIDAFSEGAFTGNPRPSSSWRRPIAPELMQRIAEENNRSETAFVVPMPDGGGYARANWFTLDVEVELCAMRRWRPRKRCASRAARRARIVTFSTLSGPLTAELEEKGRVTIDLPAATGARPVGAERLAALERAVDGRVVTAHEHRYVLAELEDEASVRALAPTARALEEIGLPLIATARGADPEVDFVSRFFAPTLGVFEDPVTGSARCQLVPYWAGALGRGSELAARQLSRRGGRLQCALTGDRVRLTGEAHAYLGGHGRARVGDRP